MTPAERWARVAPEVRKRIASAVLDRLDGVAGSDVEAAVRYLEAVPGFSLLPAPPDTPEAAAVWRERARVASVEREALRRELAEANRRAEALVSRALDVALDEWELDEDAPGSLAALVQALHEAGLYDAEEGEITEAGHALQLRAATAKVQSTPEPPTFSQTTAEAWEEATRARLGYYPGHEPDCAERQTPHGLARCACGPKPPEHSEAEPRPLRVYVAGGSSEVKLVARYIAYLRAAGVEVTFDWTADVLALRAAGVVPHPNGQMLSREQRAAHARADLDGIKRADVVWWMLPAAKSEGSAFEAGVAHGLALARIKAEPSDAPFCDPGCECASCLALPHYEPLLVVSGDRAAHGRVFPELAAQRWDSHDAALAAIVSLAAERRREAP